MSGGCVDPRECEDCGKHLYEYQHHELDAAAAERIQEHLQVCPSCMALWQEEEVEVVVLVEGTDPLTSNALQAKFSYKLPQDVAWNRAFAPCVGARHHDGGCVVDLGRFHHTRPLSSSSSSSAAAAAAAPVHV